MQGIGLSPSLFLAFSVSLSPSLCAHPHPIISLSPCILTSPSSVLLILRVWKLPYHNFHSAHRHTYIPGQSSSTVNIPYWFATGFSYKHLSNIPVIAGHLSNLVILAPEPAAESPGGLVKMQIVGPHPFSRSGTGPKNLHF